MMLSEPLEKALMVKSGSQRTGLISPISFGYCVCLIVCFSMRALGPKLPSEEKQRHVFSRHAKMISSIEAYLQCSSIVYIASCYSAVGTIQTFVLAGKTVKGLLSSSYREVQTI